MPSGILEERKARKLFPKETTFIDDVPSRTIPFADLSPIRLTYRVSPCPPSRPLPPLRVLGDKKPPNRFQRLPSGITEERKATESFPESAKRHCRGTNRPETVPQRGNLQRFRAIPNHPVQCPSPPLADPIEFPAVVSYTSTAPRYSRPAPLLRSRLRLPPPQVSRSSQ